ncbi:hypothetical protein GCM10011514_07210 [Emticicia aquatilis]|uniref:DUF218 domain-containing protein n=2 Tax=Emticicia aquatilis TaxID=1537369 RepID=A0A917DL26_9BACT|nr:hypothetical protein GCM10011514_07210 [Emticicia aquatilis]
MSSFGGNLLAQNNFFQKSYVPLKSQNPIGDRIFYFYTLLQYVPEVAQTINNDVFFKKLTNEKIETFKNTVYKCDEQTACFIDKVLWSDAEKETIASEFKRLYQTSKALKNLVNNHLLPSGYFELYKNDTGEEIVAKAWKDAANASNYIIKAYALNDGLLYPKIDSATYEVKSKYYQDLLNQLFKKEAIYEGKGYKFFFQSSLSMATLLLEINNRDEAIRFRPLSLTNSQAYQKAKITTWNKYPYTAILVLGEGPEYANIPLSPHGKLRCQIAAAKYKEGTAPFIIVSGGQVHPFQTPHCEAIEMRKYLIEHCGIPATDVIAEPHARHTTTNFRNANRIIFGNDFPTNGKLMLITSKSHLDYLTNENFNKRCIKELGYIPYTSLKRLGQYEGEYTPNITSLYLNSLEPLDP